jgi:hypothetical protein
MPWLIWVVPSTTRSSAMARSTAVKDFALPEEPNDHSSYSNRLQNFMVQ